MKTKLDEIFETYDDYRDYIPDKEYRWKEIEMFSKHKIKSLRERFKWFKKLDKNKTFILLQKTPRLFDDREAWIAHHQYTGYYKEDVVGYKYYAHKYNAIECRNNNKFDTYTIIKEILLKDGDLFTCGIYIANTHHKDELGDFEEYYFKNEFFPYHSHNDGEEIKYEISEDDYNTIRESINKLSSNIVDDNTFEYTCTTIEPYEQETIDIFKEYINTFNNIYNKYDKQ